LSKITALHDGELGYSESRKVVTTINWVSERSKVIFWENKILQN
jgi:hypothetical protein